MNQERVTSAFVVAGMSKDSLVSVDRLAKRMVQARAEDINDEKKLRWLRGELNDIGEQIDTRLREKVDDGRYFLYPRTSATSRASVMPRREQLDWAIFELSILIDILRRD